MSVETYSQLKLRSLVRQDMSQFEKGFSHAECVHETRADVRNYKAEVISSRKIMVNFTNDDLDFVKTLLMICFRYRNLG